MYFTSGSDRAFEQLIQKSRAMLMIAIKARRDKLPAFRAAFMSAAKFSKPGQSSIFAIQHLLPTLFILYFAGGMLLYAYYDGSSVERSAAFEGDHLFQDACCMCVVQIGGLVSQLSEDVKQQNSTIPWRIIKDTRNFYVHAYGAIDVPSVWETLNQDIPTLRFACEKILVS